MTETTERTPVYLHCPPCDHRWIVAWLPMPAGDFARVLKGACCPMCGKRNQVRLAPTGTRAKEKETV